MQDSPGIQTMFRLSNYVLKERARKARPADFGLDIALVYSVGVFKPFRGQGVARFIPGR